MPKFNVKERLVCMIQGKETVRIVSSIFKHNMYSGVFENLDPIESPVNLFEKENSKSKYNLMKKSDVYEASLEPGSCLYIPSYYWY
jgi:hypothetical protein